MPKMVTRIQTWYHGRRRLLWLVPLLLAAGLLAAYLVLAFWKGQSRKVFVVNGWDRPYTVAINGKERRLEPGQPTAVYLPEGDVVVEFPNPPARLQPYRCRIATPFFSRPYRGYTFVLNPDQLAILVREERAYPEGSQPAPAPDQVHFGKTLHEFEGLDYEFVPFPEAFQANNASTIRKTRVGLLPGLSAEIRPEVIGRVGDSPHSAQQIAYALNWLRLDPNNRVCFGWVLELFPDSNLLGILRPGLTVRPPRVEWHRAYQNKMDRMHPEKDLRPEYQKLVEEMKGHPDSLYLLGCVEGLDAGDRLFRQAAAANPPCAHALNALAFREFAQGKFPEAVEWAEKANQLAPEHPDIRHIYRMALLAAGRYDQLLQEMDKWPAPEDPLVGRNYQKPPWGGGGYDSVGPLKVGLAGERILVLMTKGDQAQARAVLEQTVQPPPGRPSKPSQDWSRTYLESVYACAANDVDAYLKWQAKFPAYWRFEEALLQDNLEEASGAALLVRFSRPLGNNYEPDYPNAELAAVWHGFVSLAALRAGDFVLADEQWQGMLHALGKGDRWSRQLGQALAGPKPPETEQVRRLPIHPSYKRVLLVVAARRYPEPAKDLLPLARKLNFHRDQWSLCLRRVLE